MARDSLPPDKICRENIKGMNVNETGLYGVVNEETSEKGQILNSYNVKTLTKVEYGEIYDWLKATDEENFSELNSTLEACEEIDSSVSSEFSGYESSEPGGKRSDLVVRDIGIQVCEIEKERRGQKPKVRSRSVSK